MFSAKIAPSSQNESDTIDTDFYRARSSCTVYITKFMQFLDNCAKSNQWPDKSSDDYQISTYDSKVSEPYIFKKWWRDVKICVSICAQFNISLCHIQNKGWLFYIQMTLYEGTLEQWMCQKINQTDVSMTTMQQILCGLDYIHCKDIVHHDIKVKQLGWFMQYANSTNSNNEIYLFDSRKTYSLQNRKKNL